MAGILGASEVNTGLRGLLAGAIAGLVIATFNFFWTGNGIHGTAGALLVVVSSALMVAATCALMFFNRMGRGLRGTLIVLIALDILGTGLAAYFLEATWLIAAMAVALIGWIIHLVSDPVPRQPPLQSSHNAIAQRGAE
jgi:hypothetical protein